MGGRRPRFPAVLVGAGAAILAGWFVPFIRIEGTKTARITLSDDRTEAAWWLLGCVIALFVAAALLARGRARRRALGLAIAAGLVAVYLVTTVALTFTDSPVNTQGGGPLVYDEFGRLFRSGPYGEVYLRGSPGVGFWLALAGSATALFGSVYSTVRPWGRGPAITLTITVAFVLAVLWWCLALLGG